MRELADEFGERFPLTAAVVREGMDRGLHHGAQIYVSQHANVLADVGLGIAAPNVPMTAETVNPWLSAGKPLTAMLIAQLQEAGQLDWNDSVAKFLPEFGVENKDSITIRHLLTHTAGLRAIDPGWPDVDWSESLRRICRGGMEADWTVGETAGYDPASSWFVLGEIVQRVTGGGFSEVMAERVLGPCGMTRSWVGAGMENGAKPPAIVGRMWERDRGELVLLDWHESLRVERPSPGASFRGPIRELGRFYEKLLAILTSGEGALLARESLELMTSRQRHGLLDRTFGQVVDFGFGFLIDSKQYHPEMAPYGYGRHCSPRTFGHGGSQSSQGYCDPEQGLVVAYVFNGRPGEPQHQRRIKAFNEAVYRDLERIALNRRVETRDSR